MQSTDPRLLSRPDLATATARSYPWPESRIEDAFSPPRRDDTPIYTWSNGTTTALTSPVEYRPKIVGTGTKVTGWNGQDDPVFRIAPGTFTTTNGANVDLTLIGEIKPGGASQAAGWPVILSFVANDTDTVEITFYSTPANQSLLLEINGRLLDDCTVKPGSEITSVGHTLTLKFPTTRTRTIRLHMGYASGMIMARVPAGKTITKPTNTPRTAAIIGDSFVNGAGASHTFPDQGAVNTETFAPRLLRMLGFEQMMLAGIGGTGYTTANAFSDRVPAVLAANPELLVLYGSVNDGTFNSGIRAAAEAVLASVSAVPRVIVIPPLRGEYNFVTDQLRAATKTAGRQFVDVPAFFTGSGKITVPKGDGNKDHFVMHDNIHATLDGHRALARFLYGYITTQL